MQMVLTAGHRHETTACRTLLLDRDGVINVERHYVHRIEDFKFMDDIFVLCEAAAARDYLLIVVTNQAGIGRGYYTEEDFQRLTAWMIEQFEERDLSIARVYHCPHHPIAGIVKFRQDCINRKPNPGMIFAARDDFNLDLKSSILIGDKASDIEAARRADVGTRILLNPDQRMDQTNDILVVSSLAIATQYLFGT